MNRKTIFLLLFLVSLVAGCITEFNSNLPDSDSGLLVVEGNIIENTEVDFYLSRTFSLNETAPPEGYNEIEVELCMIGSDGSKSQPALYQGKGIHRLSVGELNKDVSYGIEIKYDGEIYQSDLLTPLHTPEMDSISFIQREKFGEVNVRVSTHGEGSGSSYFLWDYEEDWEYYSDVVHTMFYDEKTEKFYEDNSAPYHWCWRYHKGKKVLVGSTESLRENRIINNTLYKHEATDQRFTYLYSVRVTQQAISKAGYEYYLDKIKANEGMGGLFTPQPSETEGNISCVTNPSERMIGFVDVAKNIVEQRIFISSGQISKRTRSKECSISEDEIAELKKVGLTNVDLYTIMRYRPAGYFDDRGNAVIESWYREDCADCRLNGGSKKKPDFWPNNHE